MSGVLGGRMKMAILSGAVAAAIATGVLAIACGGARLGPAPIYSCSPGGLRPPSKLLLHPDGGLPGQYIVVLLDSVEDVQGTAKSLATKYSGTILFVYDTVLHGFAIKVADSAAVPLSNEPTVCWVEQDELGHPA